jgi:hypothetical protein
MPRRSQAELRQEVKRFQRRSTDELYLYISRQASRSKRQNTITYRKAKSGGFSERRAGSKRKDIQIHTKRSEAGRISESRSEAAAIDSSMLRDLRSALRGEASVDDGEQTFNTLWRRLRRRVCEDWDLCDKIKRGDGGLIWKLIEFLQKGTQPSQHQLIIALVIAAFRMGPQWMCDCH